MGIQGYGPPGYSHAQPPPPPSPWGSWQGPWQGEHEMGNGRREPVDDDIRAQIRILQDIAFGSEADKQEKQIQEQMLKRLQPLIPELMKLIALQQQSGLNGAGANGGMTPGPPAGGMPAGPMGMGGMNPYGGMPGAMPGMHPLMNPMATMGGMNPMMGGGDPGMMGGGGDMGGGFPRRRPRPRRGIRDFDYDEDEEDDFGGFGRGRRGGHGGRGRRRGRYNFDDDDLFGDRGGDGEYVEPALVVRMEAVR
jgi:hypothetical protein